MAAYISFIGHKNTKRTFSWHQGESLDQIDLEGARVVTIQADGDELVHILRKLGYTRPIPGERIIKR